MKRYLTIIVLAISLGSIAYSDEAKRPWLPAWEKAGPLNWSNPVEQTEEPFIFRMHKGWGFKTEEEAKAFAKQKQNVLGIVKGKDSVDGVYYNVTYTELWDFRPLIPAEQREFWGTPKSQFALVLALRRIYGNLDEIVDGKYYRYTIRHFKTMKDAREKTDGQVIEASPKENGTGFRVKSRKAVDLIAEAKPFLQMLELSYSDLIPEDIPPYRVGGPGSVNYLNVGGITAPGKMIAMGYSQPGRPGHGSEVTVMIPDAANGLDHGLVRHLVLERGVKLAKAKEQTIITSGDGKMFLWKAGPNKYYKVAGGDPEVLDAYLKKFPSVLPKNYAFDREAWLKEEVRQTIDRLAKAVPEDPRNRYLTDYFYLCRFIEPIEGAPPIWKSFLPAGELTVDERKAHFAPVERWWKQHEKDFALRKGAPLSHGQMMALSPKDPKAVEAALKVIRATTQPTTQPR